MTTTTSILLVSVLALTFAMLGITYTWNIAHGSVSASPFNTTEETNVDKDWFDIIAQLKINTRGFTDPDDGYYDVKKFDIVLSNSSHLCPTNDCEFSFKHAESLSGFQIKDDYDRQLEGTLKVKKDGESKIYEVFGLYKVTGIDSDKQTLTGTTYISLGEDLNLGDGINDQPYQTNGTVIWKNDRKNADLSIHGDKINEVE